MSIRKSITSAAGAFVVTAMSSAALAQESCVAVYSGLTVAKAQEFAPLVAAAAKGKPEQVEFLGLNESGDWSAVYASTADSDPGYFFFQKVDGKVQFKDVWGGIADADDRPDIVAWADALGAPSDLSACFADKAVGVDD